MGGKIFATTVAGVMGSVAEACAATARQDNSSLVVWIFLGFCALIIMAQLLPVLRTLLQAARSQRERRAQQIMPSSRLAEAPVAGKEKKS